MPLAYVDADGVEHWMDRVELTLPSPPGMPVEPRDVPAGYLGTQLLWDSRVPSPSAPDALPPPMRPTTPDPTDNTPDVVYAPLTGGIRTQRHSGYRQGNTEVETFEFTADVPESTASGVIPDVLNVLFFRTNWWVASSDRTSWPTSTPRYTSPHGWSRWRPVIRGGTFRGTYIAEINPVNIARMGFSVVGFSEVQYYVSRTVRWVGTDGEPRVNSAHAAVTTFRVLPGLA